MFESLLVVGPHQTLVMRDSNVASSEICGIVLLFHLSYLVKGIEVSTSLNREKKSAAFGARLLPAAKYIYSTTAKSFSYLRQ